jgi:hypothetical protein
MSYFDKAQGFPEEYISNSLPSFRNVNAERHLMVLMVVLLAANFVCLDVLVVGGEVISEGNAV